MDHLVPPLLAVPNEILWEICKYLTRRYVARLVQTSPALYLPLHSLLLSRYKNDILLFAASKNHLPLLTACLSAGADVTHQTSRQNYSPDGKCTALHLAAAKGYTTIMTELLRYDPPLEARNMLSETPLLYAARNGHQAAVDLLLTAGSDSSSRGYQNQTLLENAICSNLKPTAIRFIDQMEESSPYTAITHKQLDILQLMAERGMQIGPLLRFAVCSGTAYVKLCLDYGGNINEVHRETRCTALSTAATWHKVNVVEYLLKNGADPNKGPKRYRPIMSAVTVMNTEIFRLLLQHGADLTDLGGPYTDVLLTACVRSPADIVELLLDSGQKLEVDGNLADLSKKGPLHVAAENENLEVIRLLLERGAKVNARRGPKAETPLHCAARAARAAAVEVLIEGGADPGLLCDGHSALMKANRSQMYPPRKRRTMAALVRGGANINELGVGTRARVEKVLHGQIEELVELAKCILS